MQNLKEELKGIKKLGNAKIAGLTCNKNSPATIRIDLEVEQDKISDVLAALDLEATDKLRASLEAMLGGLKK